MKTKVMLAGKFDLLHPGHLKFFEEAKAHGDHLTVVLARDSTIEQEKGELPLYSEQRRKEFIESISMVDEVVLGNESEDKTEIIRIIKPDVICLGYDQEINQEKLEAFLANNGFDTKVFRLNPFKENIFKSTIIKNNIKSQ